MGFSSALQGRAAHEALIVRQDAELRLMETMKRSIQIKAKCDKEYAIGLAAVAQQGLKVDRADEMQGSLIAKSWRSYMDELDQQAKQFKINAELLEVVCEKITHLSQDKRKARKAYQEEHAKIAARLNHLTDEVLRKKTEYQKHLEGYKALRTRFEEHYIKSGRVGRKLDDVRDKYQKACRKLHLTHNEYVLSITEAIEVEKDFRTVLLPGLLEHQQSVQESFILLWKNILQEASQHSDLTSEKFKEIQRRIENVINNINPNEEYREFTEKHKTSPTSPVVFQFDETLIEDIPGKLQSNTLTVDNLTVDWLRSRLIDLEVAVKDCQEKQYKMIGDLNGGSPISNGMANGIANKDTQNRQSKDLNSLRCQEKQKQKLVDMIKSALSEVGCEELPSGCDDHLNVDQTFLENSFNNDQQTTTSTTTTTTTPPPTVTTTTASTTATSTTPSANATTTNSVSIVNELMRRGGVLTLLRGPFKRKSTPQPTTPTAARNRNQVKQKMQQRSQSLGSLSVNTSTTSGSGSTSAASPINANANRAKLRMAASVEANNNNSDYDMDAIVVFPAVVGEVVPKIRRTQSSMLCVIEETTPPPPPSSNNNNSNNNLVALYQATNLAAAAAAAALLTATSTPTSSPNSHSLTNNNNHNNNNHIYAELDLANNSGTNYSPILAIQQNVQIEINHDDDDDDDDDDGEGDAATTEGRREPDNNGNFQESDENENLCNGRPETEPAVKSSIDAHLDKIDELNRSLDNRLKQAMPPQPSLTSRFHVIPIDFDTIESIDSEAVTRRSKTDDESIVDATNSSSSKRTSSSSSDSRPQINRKDGGGVLLHCSDGGVKKRSMSFSHKSINALLTNIKEFSRSPLARIHNKSSGATPTDDREIREMLDGVTVLNVAIASNSGSGDTVAAALDTDSDQTPPVGVATPTTSTTSTPTPTTTTTTPSPAVSDTAAKDFKLKFKVPKIQKKSKAIRNTFRSKIMNFQIRRGKLCKTCSKRRRFHASKSVFDFAKVEFHLTNEEDFCSCPPDTTTTTTATTNRNTPISHHTSNHHHHSSNMHLESSSSADAEDEESSDDLLSMQGHCYNVAKSLAGMSLSSTNRPLYEEEWFHGVLPREEVVRLLNNDGDFLVRETIRNEESQIVLSVCWNGHKHFIVQTTVDGHFRFEGPPFPSIQELIMHQYQSELPVTVKSGAILRRPVCRERWELSNDDVVLLEKIGRGNFGDVYKAKLKSTKQDVAVKTCRMALPDEQKRKFLQEGRILKQYDHPNIVKLIGICVQKQPIMIVMELVPGGSLLNFLRKNSNSLSPRQLMGMCRDAAAGMRYLESKNCIHRDLAARNCLIDYENAVKISDFGMSREEEEYIVSDGMKQIPVKWTAPEALNFGKYTSLCDVWSYGILMWEIFSKGDTPYSGMSNSRARERIDAGYRMPAPENTSPEMYRLMLKCWAAEPEARPHFDEIFNVVDALIIRLENTN